jgi:hypothetical protein
MATDKKRNGKSAGLRKKKKKRANKRNGGEW